MKQLSLIKFKQSGQSGFTAVKAIIGVLLVLVIGFAGMRMYGMNRVGVGQTDERRLPSNFTTYSDNTLGLKFAYPAAWGTVKVMPSAETPRLLSGNERVMTFSSNDKVVAAVASKDRRYDPAKANQTQFDVAHYSNKNLDDLKVPARIVRSQDSAAFVVSMPFIGASCEAVGELMTRKLEGNSTYPSITFAYINEFQAKDNPDDLSSVGGSEAEDICAPDEAEEYYSTEHADQLRTVSRTVSKL